MAQPTVDKTSQGYAYVILFQQEQAKNPALTPDTYKAWLKAQIQAGIAAAHAAKGK